MTMPGRSLRQAAGETWAGGNDTLWRGARMG
jgi:hypothetical protein